MRLLGTALAGAAFLFILGGGIAGSLAPSIGPSIVRAASPEPSAASGDTRSAGEAPGFVGSPLAAVGAVLGLGMLAVIGTIAYVRLTGGPGRAAEGDSPPRQR